LRAVVADIAELPGAEAVPDLVRVAEAAPVLLVAPHRLAGKVVLEGDVAVAAVIDGDRDELRRPADHLVVIDQLRQPQLGSLASLPAPAAGDDLKILVLPGRYEV